MKRLLEFFLENDFFSFDLENEIFEIEALQPVVKESAEKMALRNQL